MTDTTWITKSGCEIRPTETSVVARQRSKSFDGEWSEVVRQSASKIKIFPASAVIDKMTFGDSAMYEVITCSAFWIKSTLAEQIDPFDRRSILLIVENLAISYQF